MRLNQYPLDALWNVSALWENHSTRYSQVPITRAWRCWEAEVLRLELVRRQAGLTQAALGRETGVNQTTISQSNEAE